MNGKVYFSFVLLILAIIVLSAQTQIDSTNQIRGATVTIVDGETPGGVVNGTNLTFTLANAPNPPGSLHLFRNGLRQNGVVTADFVLSGSTINFTAGATPQTGDTLLADYRR